MHNPSPKTLQLFITDEKANSVWTLLASQNKMSTSKQHLRLGEMK